MSLAKEDFQVKLEVALREAGLPTDVEQIIGRSYRFIGSHFGGTEAILVGIVEAIEIPAREDNCVNLYVSNPYIWEEKLKSIRYCDGHWGVELFGPQVNEGWTFLGEFQLL